MDKKKVESDLAMENMKGEVSSNVVSTYFAIEKFGEVEKVNLVEKVVYKYNKQGNIVGRKDYFSDGSLKWEYNYLYDSKGNKSKEQNYNAVYENRFYNLYQYDEKGNLTDKINDDKVFKHAYKYNDIGNLIEEKHYSGKDVLSKYVYTYDEKNYKIDAKYYSGGDSLYKTTSYQYDEKGNLKKESSIAPNSNESYERIYKYEDYDKKGNWLKQIVAITNFEFSKKDIILVVERKIDYY